MILGRVPSDMNVHALNVALCNVTFTSCGIKYVYIYHKITKSSLLDISRKVYTYTIYATSCQRRPEGRRHPKRNLRGLWPVFVQAASLDASRLRCHLIRRLCARGWPRGYTVQYSTFWNAP